MAKRGARAGVLEPGGFGAFVLDQLSGLGNVEAKPMFGGAGFYLDGEFFGILYKQHLYFRVSPDTIGEYTKRKMKPFKPFEGKRGSSKNYYQVPVEILESPIDVIEWARAAHRGSAARVKKRDRQTRG